VKIDVTQTFVDFEGEQLETGAQACPQCGRAFGDTEPLTLRLAAVNALMAVYRGEELDGKSKIERYELAKRIHEGDEVSLSNKEAALLQDLINKRYASPLIVAQAWALLEGETEEEA
jgi:uncharacterized protein (UPF0212 family)